ncbi:MAG: CoA pyrophosphatase [Bacteroidetes bacterium]|nr:CoA pyrophosphatase [Bacteroidota bacterium]
MIEKKAALLREAILKGLPGTDVQWEMASSDRMIKDFPRTRNNSSRLAAVLFLLYPLNGKLHTCLIQRQQYNGVHGGQISFPGGKAEPADTSLIGTALREASEETGIIIPPDNVIGVLTPLFIPVSDTEVTPVVAWCSPNPSFRIDKGEVAHIIEADMEKLADAAIVSEKPFVIRGEMMNVKYYDLNGYVIWGATAMIIHEMITIFRREKIPFTL